MAETAQLSELTPGSAVLLEKVNSYSANQDIPQILWNPQVRPLPCSEEPDICPFPKPDQIETLSVKKLEAVDNVQNKSRQHS